MNGTYGDLSESISIPVQLIIAECEVEVTNQMSIAGSISNTDTSGLYLSKTASFQASFVTHAPIASNHNFLFENKKCLNASIFIFNICTTVFFGIFCFKLHFHMMKHEDFGAQIF